MALFEAIALGLCLVICGLLVGAIFLAMGMAVVITIKVLLGD